MNANATELSQPLAKAKATRFTASLRIPVVPENRKLLRNLRAAELAAWQRTQPSVDRTGAGAAARPAALVNFRDLLASNSAEGTLHLIVALSASFALAMALSSALHLPANWPKFVQLVRRVLE